MQYSFLFYARILGTIYPNSCSTYIEILIIGITLLSYKNILNPLCYKLLFVLSVGFICSIYTASSIAYFKSIGFVLYFFLLV